MNNITTTLTAPTTHPLTLTHSLSQFCLILKHCFTFIIPYSLSKVCFFALQAGRDAYKAEHATWDHVHSNWDPVTVAIYLEYHRRMGTPLANLVKEQFWNGLAFGALTQMDVNHHCPAGPNWSDGLRRALMSEIGKVEL